MSLESEIREAISSRNKAALPALKEAAEKELRPLLDSGNKNYAAFINGLLLDLEVLPTPTPRGQREFVTLIDEG